MSSRAAWLVVAVFALLAGCTQIKETSTLISYQPPSHPLRSSRMLVSANALIAGHPTSKTVTKLSLPNGNKAWQTTIDCEPATLAISG